jgi:hypothetical protein
VRTSTVARTAAVGTLLAAVLGWTSSSQATPPVGPTAALGAVTCVAEQGRFDITVTAGDIGTLFDFDVEDSLGQPVDFYEERDVAANQTQVVAITDLDDDDYTVTVDSWASADGEALDDEDVVLADASPVTVGCDPAPVGPYTNPRAALVETCGQELGLRADNRPIGGNTADLQPATFTVTYLPSAEPTDEPGDEPSEEPGDEPSDERRTADLDPVVLDTFTLGLGTPPYAKTYEPTGTDYFYGRVTVTADGKEIAASDVGPCASATGTNGVALPDTGA